MTDKNPEKIKNMFNTIAEKYDRNNNIISFGTHILAKKLGVKNIGLPPNENLKVLDLCTGTGDIAGFIKKNCPQCEVIGLDFSHKMIELAQTKFPGVNIGEAFDRKSGIGANEGVNFVEGDCTNLPFENERFDVVTISFGLRNIENSDKAIQEIRRVLKKSGIFMHLDFAKTNPLCDLVYDKIVPILVRIFYGNNIPYNYLIQSKQEFTKPAELIQKFEHYGMKLRSEKRFLFGMISAIYMEG